jgi:methylated-DNA-protein-cysteine methyltransferase-like protein
MSALDAGSRIPWHRVVNAQGRISARKGARDGAVLQRLRLAREGVRFDRRGAIPLTTLRWRPRAAPDRPEGGPIGAGRSRR